MWLNQSCAVNQAVAESIKNALAAGQLEIQFDSSSSQPLPFVKGSTSERLESQQFCLLFSYWHVGHLCGSSPSFMETDGFSSHSHLHLHLHSSQHFFHLILYYLHGGHPFKLQASIQPCCPRHCIYEL